MTKVSRFKVKRDILDWFMGNLWRAFTLVDTKNEMEGMLRALLSRNEIVMLAKRIQIAKMLTEGYDYRTIRNTVHVTDPTIAKISLNLDDYPEVLSVVNKLHDEEENLKNKYDSTSLRNRYPSYYALDTLIESLSKPSRKRSRKTSLFTNRANTNKL
ncbi:hypothetical protein COS52_00835 [Candidatus Roizmanbacteria bacterium CG03_land_8_20_14_0_80_39_12]|uniref:TrpR like protein, YerC/YecD n=1 Tax=Candidatus Roizmanbacteria bacterium CG03_land_8_20_14_0_80_39_12 TaxID=1974847 RepID=A0A2M7BTI1_9BACT|nr:MAG: hypothetical protein COS52_00835 [Candidatus Roizmanbacteria bacterium CG03_land_8_20_14_0_80_39_12]